MEHQSYAYGKNHWQIDPDLRAVLGRYWKNWDLYREEMVVFGGLAGGDAYGLGRPLEKHSEPVLVMHDLLGNRIDRIRIPQTQKNLLKRLAPMNSLPYEQGGNWQHYFVMGYLLADPALHQLLGATNALIYLIHKYAPEQAGWKTRLMSGGALGSAWIDEVREGSDLGLVSVKATRDGEQWRLSGHRDFSYGAGLSDYALVSARLEGSPDPSRTALFLVSRRNQLGTLNYRVQNLEEHPPIRLVPTGTVEFELTEAHMVGRLEDGPHYTQEVQTLGHLSKTIELLGLARKAQLEAFFRLQNRRTPGRTLFESALYRHDLVDLAVRLAGAMALGFRTVAAWNQTWQTQPPYTSDYHYTRLLVLLSRVRGVDQALAATQTASELLGGAGSTKGLDIARTVQESLLVSQWETPSHLLVAQALELLRKGAAEALAQELIPKLEAAKGEDAQLALAKLRQALEQLTSTKPEEAQGYGREDLCIVADAMTFSLLRDLAQAAGERYEKLAALYAQRFLRGEPYLNWAIHDPEIWQVTRETSLT